MSSKKKFVDVQVTSAFIVAGDIVKPGKTLSEVPMSEAKALAKRGKVKLLSAGDEGDSEYADMTVPELKELAEAEGIEGFEKMKKAQLVAALEALEDA